ncbi:APC family permease [Spiroplasma endosymbiont of Eupeodes luniger]|uniref:APC family permease n=1 Tax=Spiroplasma endosymbiont of Eupeodes luniger TaxID=3066300 RepID=UPI0030CF867F
MSQNVARKYGLFMCLCMVVGTVIGTGIFFKNEGVYGFVNGNGILGIIAWIIGGVVAISFGLSFMEISSAKQDSNSGIALYAKMFAGSKFGRVVRNAMNNIYLPLTAFTVAYYTSKASVWAIGGGQDAEMRLANVLGGSNVYELLLSIFAVLYTLFVIVCCIYNESITKWVQMITVVLKLIPLIFIGVAGLIVVNAGAGAFLETGLGDPKKYEIVKNKGHFEMLLMALPGILFAFDGFLSTTYIQKDVRNSSKNIPLALVFGLTGITFIYVLTSISTLNLDPSGSVAIAAGKIFNNPTVNAVCTRLIFIFILISAFGTLNGYCFSMTKLTRSSLDDGFVVGNDKIWQKVINRFGIKTATLMVMGVLFAVWIVIMALPTIVTDDNYNFFDFISNAGVVMAFMLYGVIIFYGLLNRYRKKIKTLNAWYFIPAAIISILCITLILGYNVYSYFALLVTSENKVGAILQIFFLLLILALPWLGLFMKDNELENDNEVGNGSELEQPTSDNGANNFSNVDNVPENIYVSIKQIAVNGTGNDSEFGEEITEL